MNIQISRHAKRRMKERKIARDEILQVLQYPDEVAPSIAGRFNYIKTIDARHLKVTCKEEADAHIVITVMDRNL